MAKFQPFRLQSLVCTCVPAQNKIQFLVYQKCNNKYCRHMVFQFCVIMLKLVGIEQGMNQNNAAKKKLGEDSKVETKK